MTLARASPIGSATLWRRSICAAWCETNSIFSSRRSGSRSASAMSAWTNRAASGSRSRRPEERSSTIDDAVAVGEVPLRHVRADEARAAGDEDVHRILSIEPSRRMIANKRARTRASRSIPRALGLARAARARSSGAARSPSRASLVGAWIARRWRGRWYGARIVETEAYLGAADRAAHSWGGPPHAARRAHVRRRRPPLRLPRLRDAPLRQRRDAARGRRRRRCCCGRPRAPEGAPRGCSPGPGKLCAALGITTRDSGLDLLGGSAVRIFRRRGAARRLGVSPRIGVDYAGDAKDWPLRFFDRDSRRGLDRCTPASSRGRRIPGGGDARGIRPRTARGSGR